MAVRGQEKNAGNCENLLEGHFWIALYHFPEGWLGHSDPKEGVEAIAGTGSWGIQPNQHFLYGLRKKSLSGPWAAAESGKSYAL